MSNVSSLRFLLAVFVLGASVSAPATEIYAQVRWRDIREDPAAREALVEQRRERMRQLRQELRQEIRAQEPIGDPPEHGAGLRRMSPEERVRFREDIREVWRERRSRR